MNAQKTWGSNIIRRLLLGLLLHTQREDGANTSLLPPPERNHYTPRTSFPICGSYIWDFYIFTKRKAPSIREEYCFLIKFSCRVFLFIWYIHLLHSFPFACLYQFLIFPCIYSFLFLWNFSCFRYGVLTFHLLFVFFHLFITCIVHFSIPNLIPM